MAGCGFVVQQRTIGDRDHPSAGVDCKSPASRIHQRVARCVAGIQIAACDGSNAGRVSRVFGDREARRGHIVGRVVGSLDGHCNLRGASQACRITHRVGEDVVDRVGRNAEGLDGGVVVIDCVGVSTVGSDVDRAEGTRDCRTDIDGG